MLERYFNLPEPLYKLTNARPRLLTIVVFHNLHHHHLHHKHRPLSTIQLPGCGKARFSPRPSTIDAVADSTPHPLTGPLPLATSQASPSASAAGSASTLSETNQLNSLHRTAPTTISPATDDRSGVPVEAPISYIRSRSSRSALAIATHSLRQVLGRRRRSATNEGDENAAEEGQAQIHDDEDVQDQGAASQGRNQHFEGIAGRGERGASEANSANNDNFNFFGLSHFSSARGQAVTAAGSGINSGSNSHRLTAPRRKRVRITSFQLANGGQVRFSPCRQWFSPPLIIW